MRLITAAIILSAFGTAPALAQETPDKQFEGPSLTAIGGVDVSQGPGDRKAGALYGGQGGYDWQSGKTVFGIEGEVTGATGSQCFTIYQTGGGADRSCMRSGRDFYAGGRIGTVLGRSTLLYAKAGYTNTLLNFDYRIGQTGQVTDLGRSISSGYRVGVGVEQRLGDRLILKAEYRYSNYEYSFSRHQTVAGLGFRF